MTFRKFQYLFKLFIAGSVSISILSVFSIFYSYSGVHIPNPDFTTDYIWESDQLKSTMTEGFAWLKMDKNGFNNAHIREASDTDIDILLMGSSHMEAANVASDENVGYRLNELLPNNYTYNIGISGHTIYSCVNNMENAIEHYQPTDYVILETDRIELCVDDMRKVIEGSYERIPSYNSGIVYHLQKKVPALKVIYKQIEEWKSAGERSKEEKDFLALQDKETDLVEYEVALESFLKKAADIAEEKGVKLIIFYQPTTELNIAGSLKNTTDKEYLSLFADTCKKNDILFVDMTEEFENLYETKHILAHGFSNTAVGKGHLNKYGHEVTAKKLAEIIEQKGAK